MWCWRLGRVRQLANDDGIAVVVLSIATESSRECGGEDWIQGGAG